MDPEYSRQWNNVARYPFIHPACGGGKHIPLVGIGRPQMQAAERIEIQAVEGHSARRGAGQNIAINAFLCR